MHTNKQVIKKIKIEVSNYQNINAYTKIFININRLTI